MGGKLVIETELDTKSFDAQIEETRKKLELLEKSADESNIPKQFRRSAEETRQLNVEIEKTRNKLYGLYRQQEKYREEVSKSNKEQEKASLSTSAGFNTSLKALKKFALGLIGIRGLYSLARKASSAWLSQDEELSKKFENFWLALGAAMKPILEWLADIMYKLLGYLNVFIKSFTGGRVDIIATANAAAIKKQANAMKELKNQTYGFDELNIQQTNDNKSSKTSLIPEIKLDPGIEKFVKDLGSWLGTAYDWLKKIVKWCTDNLGVGGTILVGLAAVIGVKAIVGGAGLLSVLAILEAIVVAVEAAKIFNDINETKEAIDDVNDSLDYTNEKMKKSEKQIVKAFKTKPVEDQKKSITNMFSIISQGTDNMKKDTKDYFDMTDTLGEKIVNSFTGVDKMILKSIRNTHTLTNETIGSMVSLAAQGELTDEEISRLSDYIKDYYNSIIYYGDYTGENIDDMLKEIQENIDALNGVKAHPEIVTLIKAEDKTGNTIKSVQDKLAALFSGKYINFMGKNWDLGQVIKTYGTTLLEMFPKTSMSFINKYLPFSTGGLVNKSAVGSIVNNPGRGVYIGGNTIAGEAGKEGVIPLTDPNAMTELGETIGRYITVNLTNITKLDSKTINKENVKINNDMNFIRNGGVS